ncbi:MAG TPA: dethiobiotin synthase [Burkholderiaceae bacterium]|nr:dethiobiotin synthase [Burkholderiaceae bacterium]
MSLRGCFVMGTDTGVGKTCVSAALLTWLGQQGLRAAGFKPVAAGGLDTHTQLNDDVAALLASGAQGLSAAAIGPCQLREACAPSIAAELEGRHIDRSALGAAAHRLAAQVDVLVAEGAGGVCVPLGPDWDSADLAVDLGLPIVLVVGLRLGCINHALLSAEALARRGLRLAAWVGNATGPSMPWMAQNTALLAHELTRRHSSPCLGIVPWLGDDRAKPSEVVHHLDTRALSNLLKDFLA